MLIIDGNSVYEIDEECARKKKVPKECLREDDAAAESGKRP